MKDCSFYAFSLYMFIRMLYVLTHNLKNSKNLYRDQKNFKTLQRSQKLDSHLIDRICVNRHILGPRGCGNGLELMEYSLTFQTRVKAKHFMIVTLLSSQHCANYGYILVSYDDFRSCDGTGCKDTSSTTISLGFECYPCTAFLVQAS